MVSTIIIFVVLLAVVLGVPFLVLFEMDRRWYKRHPEEEERIAKMHDELDCHERK